MRKSKPMLEFKYEDVTFLVKPEATEFDRLEVALAGRQDGKDIVFSRAEYAKTLVRCMVTGWKGAQRDGKDVPYSFEEIADIPKVRGRNVMLELSGFIMDHTDIHKDSGEHIKKD